MNADINNKIIELMKDLVRIRDISPQNFSVYLAKMSTEDKKESKLPIKSGQLSHRPPIISEKSEPAEVRDGSHRYSQPSRISRPLPPNPTVRHVTRAAIMSTSKLPTTLRSSPNSSITHPPKISTRRSINPKEIAASIEAQSSNLKLTSEERDSLISTILSKELELRSKLDAQANELLSSPKFDAIQNHKTPSNPPKRLRPNSIRNSRPRQSNYGPRTPLSPIPEASEVEARENDTMRHDNGRNIVEGTPTNLETIKARENLRQQQMESELPNEFIQDTNASLLFRSSDESDSFDELVVKDFAIHVVQSKPDAAITSLPITEQAIIESNKLNDAIESVRERFQIKVARDKYAEQQKRKVEVPKTQTIGASIPSTPRTTKQTKRNSTPISLIDSKNWGDVALQRPIFDSKELADELISTSEEDFLNKEDMQFDDHFGVENVSEPTTLRKVPQHEPQKNNETSNRIEEQAKQLVDSYVQNITDLESPQFSDIPSDESLQMTPPANFNVSKYRESQFTTSPPSDRMTNKSASEQFKNESKEHNTPNGIESVYESQHEKDIKKIKELLTSGALTSSIANERFEEGVLDLLLRQSDSLWDPVVVGIPISYFIPTQNHESGLLDTKIHESNLHSPLIKKPEKKLPGYMEPLENEWTAYIEQRNASPDVNNKAVQENYELVKGLPKFSYEPAPQYLYRKKIHNIMDSEDESEDSLNILADDEMSVDDFANNIAEPTYDFKLGKIFDDLEIKMKILRRLKENNEPSVKMSVVKTSTQSPLEIFNRNEQQLNTLFGIAQNNTTPNDDSYVPSNEIESLLKKIPLIEGQILRNVENCRYHLELMKSTYKIIVKYMSQPEQPMSSQMHDNFDEIIKTINKINDGRICARLQFCPTTESPQPKTSEGKYESPTKQNNQATQTGQASAIPIQSDSQKPVPGPVKICKTVSFVGSVKDDESSKAQKDKQSGSVPDKKTERASKRSSGDDKDVKTWTTLDISQVRDLIEHARSVQARAKDSNQQKVKKSRLK